MAKYKVSISILIEAANREKALAKFDEKISEMETSELVEKAEAVRV